MSYREEFPDFPPETMPAIPAAFLDISWHNDACPCFESAELRLILFVDYADKALSEFPHPETPRFTLHDFIDGETRDFIKSSDDWADILAHIVARQFAIEIKKDISPDEMRQVAARNKTPEYAGIICASHDFCDANMSMLAAFENLLQRSPLREEGGMSDEDTALWSEAWSIAKAADFWIEA